MILFFYIASWYTLCIIFFIHCDLSIYHMFYFLLRNIFDIMIYTVFYFKSYLYFKDLILYSIYIFLLYYWWNYPSNQLKIFFYHQTPLCSILYMYYHFSFPLSTQCGKLCVSCWCVLFVVLHSKSIFFLQEYSLFLFYCACKLTLW